LGPCWNKNTSWQDRAHWFGIDSYVLMSLLTSEPMRSCPWVWHWELPAYVLVDIVAKIMPIGLALIVSCLCPCWHWSLWDRAHWFDIDSASDWIRFEKLRSCWHWSLWDNALWFGIDSFTSCTWTDKILIEVSGERYLNGSSGENQEPLVKCLEIQERRIKVITSCKG